MIAEAAEPHTVDECTRCGVRPARGFSYVYDGLVNFRCDECGREMQLGVLEEINRRQLEKEYGHRRAKENRSRFLDEWQVKMGQDYLREKERMKLDPGALLEEEAGIVWNHILPG